MTINLTARNWSPKAVPAVLGIGLILVPLVTAHAAEGHARGPSEIVFLCQIIALLVSAGWRVRSCNASASLR